MMSLSLFLVMLLNAIAAFASSTCYFPNQEEATGNYPCDRDTDVSVCCGGGSVCLSNKVCLSGGQETIRGACTDQQWLSPECPGWCTGRFAQHLLRPACMREKRTGDAQIAD